MNQAPVVILPIEPFEERYSSQWIHYFKRFVETRNIPHIFVSANPVTDKIEQGEFLDIYGTNLYKMRQLQIVIEGLRSGTIPHNANILLLDGWFPGIETLFYIRDALSLGIKIYGCLHAGTWDDWDFLTQKGMASWAKRMEKSWISHCTKSFVATDFHKELINDTRSKKKEADKVVVTGFPFYWEDDPIWYHKNVSWESKENICVFPHRLAVEKNVPAWKEFVDMVKRKVPHWQFLCTKLECKTKEEYYQLLAKSKIAVSTAYQETWGIAMQEAVYSGCIPLVPDRLSYREMYPADFRYASLEQLADRFIRIVSDLESHKESKWVSKRRECESDLRGNNHQALTDIFTEMGYTPYT